MSVLDAEVVAEVVLADGELVAAGPDQKPDLFWVLRVGRVARVVQATVLAVTCAVTLAGCMELREPQLTAQDLTPGNPPLAGILPNGVTATYN